MTWMQNLYEEHGDYKINQITLPGTHDSGAYKLMNCMNCILPLKNWTKTQDLTIIEQLKLGIRQLDIRVAYLNNCYYVSHTFKCCILEDVLRDIIQFNKQNNEIVVVTIKPDWEHRQTINKDKLYQFIDTILDTNIVIHYKNAKDFNGDLSYNDLKTNNKRILMIYDIGSHWLNKPTIKEWKIEYDKIGTLDYSKYNMLDFVLTPTEEYIKKNIFSSIKNMAGVLRPEMEKTLVKNWNVINGDFVDKSFVDSIINYNLKAHFSEGLSQASI